MNVKAWHVGQKGASAAHRPTLERGRNGGKEIIRTSEGSNVLERSSLGGGSSNDDGVLHGIVLLKGLDELGDGGTLLANSDVDAVELLGLVVAAVPALLVQDGVQSDGSLSGLTITNDQLTLTTANGNHCVDGLETSLHGLVDGATGQDTRSLELGTAPLGGLDGALAVNGVSERIDDTTEKSLADTDVDLFICELVVESVGAASHTI